jgi:hypothetical protein
MSRGGRGTNFEIGIHHQDTKAPRIRRNPNLRIAPVGCLARCGPKLAQPLSNKRFCFVPLCLCVSKSESGRGTETGMETTTTQSGIHHQDTKARRDQAEGRHRADGRHIKYQMEHIKYQICVHLCPSVISSAIPLCLRVFVFNSAFVPLWFCSGIRGVDSPENSG